MANKSYELFFFLAVEGAGLVPWVGGWSPGCFFWALPKRSIPTSDPHRKDIILRQLLGTECYRN